MFTILGSNSLLILAKLTNNYVKIQMFRNYFPWMITCPIFFFICFKCLFVEQVIVPFVPYLCFDFLFFHLVSCVELSRICVKIKLKYCDTFSRGNNSYVYTTYFEDMSYIFSKGDKRNNIWFEISSCCKKWNPWKKEMKAHNSPSGKLLCS